MITDCSQPAVFLFNYTIKFTLCSSEVSQEKGQAKSGIKNVHSQAATDNQDSIYCWTVKCFFFSVWVDLISVFMVPIVQQIVILCAEVVISWVFNEMAPQGFNSDLITWKRSDGHMQLSCTDPL